MNRLYPFTTLALVAFLLFNGANAQDYTGRTYTAITSGNWHVENGQNIWDPSGEPSPDCATCKIIISPGTVVTLNRHVTLRQSSVLIIGSAGSTDVAMLSVAPSGAGITDWTSANNIIILNDNSNPKNAIQLASSNALINVQPFSSSSSYDGVFTTFPNSPTIYYKQVGNGIASFVGTQPSNLNTVSTPMVSGSKMLVGDGTLPIILSDFNATLNNKQTDLDWTTEQESNSDHFAIGRSTDAGAHWEVLGTVAAKGNSSVASHYSFVDINPGAGVNEYRLQSIDRDGQSVYSGIVTVRGAGLIGNVSVYPNPAKDYVNVTLGSNSTATGTMSVRLITQSGQLLVDKKVNNTGGTTISLPVSSYPQGNYLIQVTGPDGTQQISKVFISRL